MEYIVVRRQARNLEAGFSSLENLVNEKLASGWTLVGGHCVTCYELGFVFTQAMSRPLPQPGPTQTTFVTDVYRLNNFNQMRG